MDTVTELDISVLVGEMEAPKCEHSQHQEKHPDEPATHYIQPFHPCCGAEPGRVYTACQYFVDYVRLGAARIQCSVCRAKGDAWEMCHILGPIENY